MGDKKLTGPSTSQSLGPVSTRGEPCVRNVTTKRAPLSRLYDYR